MTAFPDVHAPYARTARRARYITVRRRVEVITFTRIEMAAALFCSAALGAVMGVCLLAMIH